MREFSKKNFVSFLIFFIGLFIGRAFLDYMAGIPMDITKIGTFSIIMALFMMYFFRKFIKK
jgi:hypothetical protein